MSQLHTVEAYVVDSIKQEQLPEEIAGCPLSVAARRLIMAECPVVVVTPGQEEAALPFSDPRVITGYDATTLSLRQPTVTHRRSFELRGANLNEDWQDQYGNTFGSFNLKGNNFSNPGVLEHPTAIDEFIAWGLQESKIIERVLKVSEVMRSRNIGTEYIVGLSEPKTYPWPIVDSGTVAYENIPLSDYRERIVDTYWRQLPKDDQTLDKLLDMTAKFNKMTFYISMRAADTVYRLGDVWNDVESARSSVFAYINANLLEKGDEPLNPHVHEDWNRYRRDYLGPRVAKNLARLHEDMAHGFMHSFNITALGSIVDTDSVHGEPIGLGDAPVTDKERASDLFTTASSLRICDMVFSSENSELDPVWLFFSAYIQETIIVQQDPSKARKQIGNMLVAFRNMLDSHEWQDARFDTSGETFLAGFETIYLDRFFMSTDLEPSYQALDAAVTTGIGEYLQETELRAELEQALRDNVEAYAQLLIDEYINELEDPNFDVMSELGTRPDLEAYLKMRNDLKAIIREGFRSRWLTLAGAYLPEITDDATLSVSFEGHMQLRDKVLTNIASAAVQELLPSIIDALAPKTCYTRPESLLQEKLTRPMTGKREQFLWLTTEDVPIKEAITLIQENDYPYELREITDIKMKKAFELEIEYGAALNEIITDGMVGCSIPLDNPAIQVILEETTESTATYALLVMETPGETKALQLYVKPEIMAATRMALGLPVISHTPELTLF